MRLNDFGIFLLVTLIVFGHGYHAQKKHDLCKELSFKSKQCEMQKRIEESKKCCSK